MRVGLCLPHLKTGGIEKGFVSLLAPLRDRGIDAFLFLQYPQGDLLSTLPKGTPVIGLGEVGVLRTAWNLAERLRETPVDLLCAATNAMNIAALLAARRMGASAPPVVVGEHIPIRAFLAMRRFSPLRIAMMRALYPRAAGLVTPSQPLIDEHVALLGAACPPGRVLPNPVVAEVAPLRNVAPMARAIVSLGRLSPEKGFDLALRAFAHHSQQDPKARLTIYGTGPERDTLLGLAASLNLTDKVSLPGHTAKVADVLATADLYLCTSHIEGFGNAIVEAQAAGVPVLSVDCPVGPRILLQGGQAGRLVTGRDPRVVGHALTAFAGDRAARQQAVARGREGAMGYTQSASADTHADFFREVARRENPSRG
jgi:glycosyltransferase involved in cell wall biosynthesis